MARITYIGGENDGDLNHNIWPSLSEKKDYRFPLNQPVEVTDPHIIAKASTNRYFRVEGTDKGEVRNDTPIVTATDAAGKDIEAEIMDDPTADEVLRMAEEPMPFMAFRAEARKVLGDETPVRKTDIIAALQERT